MNNEAGSIDEVAGVTVISFTTASRQQPPTTVNNSLRHLHLKPNLLYLATPSCSYAMEWVAGAPARGEDHRELVP